MKGTGLWCCCKEMDCSTAKCYGSDRIRTPVPRVTNWAIAPPPGRLGRVKWLWRYKPSFVYLPQPAPMRAIGQERNMSHQMIILSWYWLAMPTWASRRIVHKRIQPIRHCRNAKHVATNNTTMVSVTAQQWMNAQHCCHCCHCCQRMTDSWCHCG